jgi:hypothetical protein
MNPHTANKKNFPMSYSCRYVFQMRRRRRRRIIIIILRRRRRRRRRRSEQCLEGETSPRE